MAGKIGIRLGTFMANILAVLALSHPAGGCAQGMTAQKARWKNGAKAAFSMIHDDICGEGTDGIFNPADSIAFNRGITFGAGAIVGDCERRKLWKKLDLLVEHGHEIVSHSWSHVDARKGWSAAQEIDKSKAALEANLAVQKKVEYFIFPFDSYDAGSISGLKAAGYLSARTGPGAYSDRGVTTRLEGFQPFGSTFFFVHLTSGGNAAMQKHASEAIASGGWAMQEFHGVADASWEKVASGDVYRQYMDWLKAKVEAGELWVATPSQVVKYIMTCNASGTPTMAGPGGDVLTFPAAAIPADYATSITVILTVPSAPTVLTARQGTNYLPIAKKAVDRFLLSVDPTRGPVTLSTDPAVAGLGAPLNKSWKHSFRPAKVTGRIQSGGYRLQVVDLAGRRIGKPILLPGKEEIILDP